MDAASWRFLGDEYQAVALLCHRARKLSPANGGMKFRHWKFRACADTIRLQSKTFAVLPSHLS